MRSSTVFIIALFIFSTHMGSARELNGNLDYMLKSEEGIAKLNIINKKTDTPVQLKSITVIFSSKNDKEQRRIEIPISQNQPIAENVTIELGAESDLAQQLLEMTYPGEKISQFKSVNVSEETSCKNCNSIGFAIEINTEYENANTKQNNLTVAFMNYIKS
jgi:hypothetical protein